MATLKIAITLSEEILSRLDELVASGFFPNRSKGLQIALAEKLSRISGSRLERECSKLDPELESQEADIGLLADLKEWPEY